MRREPQPWRDEAAVGLDRLGMLPLALTARRFGGVQATSAGLVRTIMFTDLVGSTELNVRTGDITRISICSTGTTRSCVGAFDSLMVSS